MQVSNSNSMNCARTQHKHNLAPKYKHTRTYTHIYADIVCVLDEPSTYGQTSRPRKTAGSRKNNAKNRREKKASKHSPKCPTGRYPGILYDRFTLI